MTAGGPVPLHRFGEGGITSLAVSLDGRYLATATNPGDVDVWELPTGRSVGTIREGRGTTTWSWNSGEYSLGYTPNHLAFSPDSKRLVYAARDTLRLWDPRSGQEVLALNKDPETIYRIHFSPDGQRLLLLGKNERWRVFDAAPLSPDRLYGRAVPAYVDKLVKSLHLKSRVVERIKSDPRVDEAFRSMALAETTGMLGDATILNFGAWAVIKQPGLDIAEYTRALEDAEAGHRLEPDDSNMLNTLGAAQYRAGHYADAFETLLRAESLHCKETGAAAVEDLAYLAMTCHRLGKTDMGNGYLEKLRAGMKAPEHSVDEENQELLREVEMVLKTNRGSP